MEKYSIQLPKRNLKKLLADIWADNYVNATLTVEQQDYKVKLGLR